MIADAALAGVESDASDERRELRSEMIQFAAIAAFALAMGLLSFAVFGLNRVEPRILAIVIGLVVAAAGAHAVLRVGPTPAAVFLVSGLATILLFALAALPANVVAPWISLLVLLAAATLGWKAGAATATLAGGGLLVVSRQGWIDLPTDVTASLILLGWSGLFVSWMIARPTQTALAWSSASYRQTLELIREARQRQAELSRLSKSLSVSHYQLEQLNLDLERARRVAQEARRLKAEFAAAVSHELRTPLNLIVGFGEMMVLSAASIYGRRLPHAFRDDLEAIYRNACHLSALVDDVLDLSQIDADRMALHRQWVPVGEVVAEAVDTVATLLRDRGLDLDVDLAGDLPSASIDPTRIRQILINLLTNAARFTDHGGVAVRACRDGRDVLIAVADTGPGIAPDDLPYVFEDFFQVGDRTPRRGGSGLGLAVSRRFAELHQGAMWVESVPGQGSTFYLRLPIESADVPVGSAEETWAARLADRVRGQIEPRILVVAESEELGRVLRRYLDGFQVITEADLDRLSVGMETGSRDSAHPDERPSAGPIHAVIVDSAAARARWDDLARLQAQWQAVPVVHCPLQMARRLAVTFGVAGWLVKPVSRDRLRVALRGLGRPLRRVLVVEDEPEMQRLLTQFVRSMYRGVHLLTARDGQEALNLARQSRPDAILLDLLMPALDGYGVIESLRSDPELADVPIVVITARGTHDESIVAEELILTRPAGLTAAEVVRWLKAGLGSLLMPAPTAQASRSGTGV